MELYHSYFCLFFPFFSQFEENFEDTNAVEEQPSIPETPCANNCASSSSSKPEIRENETAMQGVEPERMCLEASTSQDFVSGILKIVPEVDVSHSTDEYDFSKRGHVKMRIENSLFFVKIDNG